MPLDVLRLVLIAAAGLVFFSEPIAPSLIIGMIIIMATTLYTVRTNARHAPPPTRSTRTEPSVPIRSKISI